MPYSQTPIRVAYPNIQTEAWAVISKLSELPLRVVPSLAFVNHSSEFALPFPTGRVPYKAVTRTVSLQEYNDEGQPLYDDGLGGTTNETDGNGVPYPPLMDDNATEDQLISLRDFPELFTLEEVREAVVEDFLRAFPFYDQGQLLLFDDRYDGTTAYQGQQAVSGLASGSHPFFLGPFQGQFDATTDPRGHFLLIAPLIEGASWFFQIRHGVAGLVYGFKGPIADLDIASRQQDTDYQELTPVTPMVNLPLIPKFLTDGADPNVEVSHFWLRSRVSTILQPPYPIIPFCLILLRGTGASNA